MSMTLVYDFETRTGERGKCLEFTAERGSSTVRVYLSTFDGPKSKREMFITSFRVDDFYLDTHDRLKYAVWRWNVREKLKQEEGLYQQMKRVFKDKEMFNEWKNAILKNANGREYYIMCFLESVTFDEKDKTYCFFSDILQKSFYVDEGGLIIK